MRLSNTVSCEQGTAHSSLPRGRGSRRKPARRPPIPRGSRGSRRTCLLYTSDAAEDMQCVDLG
eukprot:6524968-Alexandrium_andersonii.AAC.1